MSTTNPPNFASNPLGAIPVYLAGNPNTGGSGQATGLPVAIQKAAAVTAAQVSAASIPLASGMQFAAPASNTAAICIGPAGVTLTTGFKLSPGQQTAILPITNANQMYFIGANTADVIVAIGI